MTTELAVRTASLDSKIEYARFLAKANLLPRDYRDQPANILFAVEYGDLLGLHPMAAITGINIIDGKPSISAGLISALVRTRGHKLRVTGNDEEATCQIIRADDPGFVYTAVWTVERAKTAGLLGKTNWIKYRPAMLKARAVSECARDACQEVLLGIAYTPDELGADDDGGELVHDGWPTLPSGQLDLSNMSEQAKDASGNMVRADRVKHDELRRSVDELNPDAVERRRDEDPDDPWQLPAPGPKSPPAPESWRKNLVKLADKFPVGTPEDRAVLYEWLTGRALPAGIDDTMTRSEVKLIADMLRSHLETAQGDYEVAASNLWEQYRNAHVEEDEVPGD